MGESTHFWARLKPQDQGRGYLLGGLFVSCFGKTGGLAEGGDGITTIPVWYRVTPEQATKLRLYKQTDERGAPDAFDIVGDEDRAQIDRGEEMNRKIALGLVPKPVDVSDQHLRAHERNMTPPAELEVPAPVAASELVPIAPAGSRAAALAGLDRWKKLEVPVEDPGTDADEDPPEVIPLALEPLPVEDGHDLSPAPDLRPAPYDMLQAPSEDKGPPEVEPYMDGMSKPLIPAIAIAPPPAGPPPSTSQEPPKRRKGRR